MRVVVIGAGLGGLAAAIRLQARGLSVTLIEKLDRLGGRAATFRQDGFVFDAGPTVVTAPWLLEELFTLAGQWMSDRLSLVPVDPFYRIRFDDGRSLDYTGDAAIMEERISAFSPGDVDGYRRLLVESERIFRVGFEQLGDLPFDRLGDFLRVVPAMIRLRSHESVHRFVGRYIRDESLRQALTFHPLLVGGNPFRTTSIYALVPFLERKWGVWWCMGGTGEIVRALGELFLSLGGTLELGSGVEEILVDGRRVRGVRVAGGRVVPAEIVVSNADAPYTYQHLLPPSLRRHWRDRRLGRLRYSMGLVVLYFGARGARPDLAHHTILLGPRYRELIEEIFEGLRLPPDLSLYLHAPSRTDPGLAPAGCETFYALAPVPHLGAGVDWAEETPRVVERIVERLEETVLPGVREQIVSFRVVTPRHFHDVLGSVNGAGFSIQPTLGQSGWFRFHNRSEELDGLYLVGAGTHPGAGIPGVLSSAKVVDRLIPDFTHARAQDPIAGSHAHSRGSTW